MRALPFCILFTLAISHPYHIPNSNYIDNECTTPCGQEGLHEGQYWCHTYDSWKFCNPIYLSKEENSYYGTHQSPQSYYPSTSVKRVDRRGQSALHKVIGKIKSVFTNVRRSFDTFSLQTVIRRVRDFFSVINRRYSNTYGSSSIVSTLSKVNRRYDNTIRPMIDYISNYLTNTLERQGIAPGVAQSLNGLFTGLLIYGLSIGVQAVLAALNPIQSQDVTAGSPANRPEGTVITVTQGGQTRTFVVRGGVWVDISFGGFRRTGFARADDVKDVLNKKYCGDNVKNLLSGTCSIQSVEFKAQGTGTYVDFVVVVEAAPTAVDGVVTQLKTVNNNLGMDEGGSGINFVGSLIEECTGAACNKCPGGVDLVNGQCPETFKCVDNTSCGGDSQGTCNDANGQCTCQTGFDGKDCSFKLADSCDGRRIVKDGFCQNCPIGQIPNDDRTSCKNCDNANEIVGLDGECAACEDGTSPNGAKTACSSCPATQILQGGECQDCPENGQVPNLAKTGCNNCSASFIAKDGLCQPCKTAGEVPNSDQSACEACAGNAIVQNGQCTDCGSGMIPSMDRLMCVDCDKDKITADGTMCMMCATAGHVPNDDQNACVACPKNQIAKDGTCQACPNPLSEIPNSDQTGCDMCAANQIVQDADPGNVAPTCVACPTGATSDGTGECTCTATDATTDGTADCKCAADFQFNADKTACVACPTGSTSDGTGECTCTATDATTDGTADCKCAADFQLNADKTACVACPTGATSDGTGECACTATDATTDGTADCKCAADFQFNADKTACVACPTGATSDGTAECTCTATDATTDGTADCKCAADFQFNADKTACVACPTGATSDGTAECTCTATDATTDGTADCKCAENFEFNSDKTACVACPTDATSDGTSACKCSAPKVPQNGQCEVCGSGMIPSMDMLMCVDCDEDEITADGKMCMMCATAGHVPNADQNACEPCPKNQIAKDGKCQACPNPLGEIPNPDQTDCEKCPANHVVKDADPGNVAPTCMACPTGATSDGTKECECTATDATTDGTADCKCAADFQFNADKTACVACPTGATSDGTKECECTATDATTDGTADCKCAIDFQFNADKTACVACPTGATSDGTKECECTATDATTDGTADCKCAADFQFNADKTACVACPTGATSDGTKECECTATDATTDGTADCKCAADFQLNSDKTACVACPTGATSDGTKECECTATGATTDGTADCKCAADFQFNADKTACVACPTGATSDGTKECECTATDATTDGTADCKCAADFQFNADKTACVACPTGATSDGTKECECTATDATTDGTADCKCAADFQLNADKTACVACPTGATSDGTKECECTATDATTDGTADCKCATDFQFNADKTACVACPTGATSDGTKECECTATDATTDGTADCKCAADFQLNADKTACVACPTGATSDGTKECECTATDATTDGTADCKCAENFQFNADKTACVACPTGATSDGTSDCKCPENFQFNDDKTACVAVASGPCPTEDITGLRNAADDKLEQGGKCYMFNEAGMTKSHDEAAGVCSPKGKLFEPMSSDFSSDTDYSAIIAEYIRVYPNKDDCWIGIKDNTPADNTANDWIYISSNDAITTTFWKGSGNNMQPKDGSGNCLFLGGNNGKWSNGVCSTAKNFICEFAEGTEPAKDECQASIDCTTDPAKPRCDTTKTPKVCAGINGQCPGNIADLIDDQEFKDITGSCIRFSAQGAKKNHDVSKKFCNDNGGRLYEPASQTDFDGVFTAWKTARGNSADAWIGVSLKDGGNQATNDDWEYSTRPGEKVAFTPNWAGGTPDGTFSCVSFKGNNGKWENDRACDGTEDASQTNFICEF